MSADGEQTLERARAVAASAPDPELPMLTVADLGILREVVVTGERAIVTITPTYSGCPAMREITLDLRHRLHAAGFDAVEVRTQLTPPWTSAWITEAGRRKLAAAGIAPPRARTVAPGPVRLELGRTGTTFGCPNCGATDTVDIAHFSGTACKALHRCSVCREPFESIKDI